MGRERRFQVVIVGGGPAGLAAAIALRQRGLGCAVFDGQHPPVDKACGEGLMPDALEALDRLGVSLDKTDGHPIQGIRFHGRAQSAHANFSHRHGLGVRRLRLHQRLLARAEALGAEFFWNSPVSRVAEETAVVGGEPVGFDWLVLADGQSSTLFRKAGFPEAHVSSIRLAARKHYAVQPWSEAVEVYWRRGKQIYVTPTGPCEVGIALLAREWPQGAPGDRVESALAEFPGLAERLRGSLVSSRTRGAATSNRRLPHVSRNRIALVGDASGSVDAITGEGLAVAFRQALLVAQSIEESNLHVYEFGHRMLRRDAWTMSRILLAMDRSPRFQDLAIDVLARRPAIFQALLDVHTGLSSLPQFALRHGHEVLWQLLQTVGSKAEYRLGARSALTSSPAQQHEL